MLPAARVTDLSSQDPCGANSRPAIVGSSNVFINDLPAHVAGSLMGEVTSWSPHACPGSPPHNALTIPGQFTVFINDLPAARMTDLISCGSVIMTGSGDTFIGG